MDSVTQIIFPVLVCCAGPLFFTSLGVWLAKGMPGVPFKMVRKEGSLDDFE